MWVIPSLYKGSWVGIAAAESGSRRLRDKSSSVPCQDAAIVHTKSAGALRPCAVVADGAGSAKLSHLGANALVQGLPHFIRGQEKHLASLLDNDAKPPEGKHSEHAKSIVKQATLLLQKEAQKKEEAFKNFRCTLLVAIVGKKWILWVQVGDGYIIREENVTSLGVVRTPQLTEFLNETNLVAENLDATRFYSGVLATKEISGLILMTDGAAERLVVKQTLTPASYLSTLLKDMRKHMFPLNNQKRALKLFLANEEIWTPKKGYTGDDKGLSLLAFKPSYLLAWISYLLAWIKRFA